VKGGLKVYPGKTTLITLLSREDVGNEMVPVEEPTGLKDIENIENGKLVVVRDNQLCVHRNGRDNGRHQGTGRSRK